MFCLPDSVAVDLSDNTYILYTDAKKNNSEPRMEEGSETTQTHSRSKIFQKMQQSKTCSSNTMTISNMHATPHIRLYVVRIKCKQQNERKGI